MLIFKKNNKGKSKFLNLSQTSRNSVINVACKITGNQFKFKMALPWEMNEIWCVFDGIDISILSALKLSYEGKSFRKKREISNLGSLI